MRKAAAFLNVASSALNRQILDLEANLGVQLFERLPRGVRLTSAGEMLLGHVRRMARDFEQTRSQIEDLRGLRRGHVRVAAIEAMAGVIGRLIVASQRDHPRVSFEYSVTGSREVVSAVLSEETDIGYAFNPPADRGFQIVAETIETLHAIMARNHPLAGNIALRLTDCSGYPLLLGDISLGGRHLLDAAAEQASMPLSPVVTGNSIEVMKTIAADGQGICFQIGIRPEDEPHLMAIPLTDKALRGRLAIGVKKNRQLPSAAAVFLETMKTDMLRRSNPDG
ncbi:MAG: LysR family transcriptional regulator [Rhodospirillales bacterium]|nr:LysR family transcriptional regulator [Rhodospirillales bacterium]